MVNTEKPTGKAEQKRQEVVAPSKQKVVDTAPVKKPEKVDEIKTKTEETKKEEKTSEKKEEVKEKKTEAYHGRVPREENSLQGAKKSDVKKIKKIEAVVNSFSLPISTKISCAICKFIKGKKIDKAIEDLNEVIHEKKAVPMKGEIPHRKGKGIMSGRFPGKAATYFITLLKALKGNSNANELENPRISEAIANLASRPFGKQGKVRKKRTHVMIKVMEKKLISKTNWKGKKMKKVNKKEKTPQAYPEKSSKKISTGGKK